MSRFLSNRFCDLEEYVPGEQPKDMQYIKLNTNESPYPPSPTVREAIDRQVDLLRLYPDPDGRTLVSAIAERYGVGPENILLSNGSDEILFFYFTAFCDNAHPVVFPDITYGFYPVYAKLLGVPFEEIPLSGDFKINTENYIGINKNIVIANPNAPTGLAVPTDEIEKIILSNPDNVVLVDEAYVDFGADSSVKLCKKYKNLLVVRTFSKSRSMAGARLGFAIADGELIKDLYKIKYSVNPYNVNRMTLAAGKAAIDEDEYYMENCRRIADCREKTETRLKKLGYEVTDSKANFIFARSGRLTGDNLYKGLKEKGVLVRHFNREPISDFVRITVGTPEQMDRLIDCIKELEGTGL